jgi:hypothetical protein
VFVAAMRWPDRWPFRFPISGCGTWACARIPSTSCTDRPLGAGEHTSWVTPVRSVAALAILLVLADGHSQVRRATLRRPA